MPITLNYLPNANLVGTAANRAGLGEFLREQQRLAEQQYQFDQELALRQQQFSQGQSEFDRQQALRERALEGELEQDAFQRQMAGRQEYLQRYGLLQRAAEADANRQSQLAQDAMRYDYGLMSDAIAQQGMAQRQELGLANQQAIAADAQQFKLMQADRTRVQEALPFLVPDEQQDLIDQFNQKWQRLDVPAPMQAPQLPEWMDPQTHWDKISAYNEAHPDMPIVAVPDENGMPQGLRGFNVQQTEGYWNRQKEMEGLKNESKSDAARQKLQYDAAQQQVDLEYRERTANLDLIADTLARRAEMQSKIADLHRKMAEMKVPKVDPVTNVAGPVADTSAMEAEIAELENILKQMTPPAPYVPPSQQMGAAYDALTGAAVPRAAAPSVSPSLFAAYDALTGVAVPAGNVAPLTNTSTSKAQWDALPIGGVMILPNGKRVRKTGPTSYEPI